MEQIADNKPFHSAADTLSCVIETDNSKSH